MKRAMMAVVLLLFGCVIAYGGEIRAEKAAVNACQLLDSRGQRHVGFELQCHVAGEWVGVATTAWTYLAAAVVVIGGFTIVALRWRRLDRREGRATTR